MDPGRTIPRAIPLALGLTLAVYAIVAVSALLATGPDALARSEAPLEIAVRAGSLDGLTPVVRVGGAVAAPGVLLSLIVGVSRTVFAMAANRELPHWLDAVHPTHRVPHHAELAVGALVGAVVLIAESAQRHRLQLVRGAHLLRHRECLGVEPARREQRRWPRWLAAAGAMGCVVLAFTLPAASVVSGAAVLATGALIWLARRSVSPSRPA